MDAAQLSRMPAHWLYRQKLPAGVTVERAYRDQNGCDVPDGWDVFVNGEWGNRYPTKIDAIFAILSETAQ